MDNKTIDAILETICKRYFYGHRIERNGKDLADSLIVRKHILATALISAMNFGYAEATKIKDLTNE